MTTKNTKNTKNSLEVAMRVRAMLMGAVLVVCCGRVGLAANYFVDFDGGKDENSGTAVGAAWKHCPGDKEAAGVAKGAKILPGDEVIFKGGVCYRGTVVAPAGGVDGKPVVLDGNTAGTFGTGRAIIDGSELITGWRACASAEEAGGNANWKHIIVATVPGSVDPMAANLFEGERMAWTAQEPNLKDPFYFDDLTTFRKAPMKDVTVDSVVDVANFTQTDAHAWDGATVIFWGTPNLVYQRKVTGFDPAEHKLNFEKVPAVYKDRDSLYAIANSLRVLDVPGESVVTEGKDKDGRRTVYYWPQEEGDLGKKVITYSARGEVGIDLAGKSYVTIQGFIVQKQGGTRASAMRNEGGKPMGVLVKDNEVRWNRSSERSNAVTLAGLQHSVVEGNFVHDNVRARGLAFNDGDDLVVQKNTLKKNGGTGIAFFTCVHSKMMFNVVREHNGVHANGLTVYVNSSDVLVFGNEVYDSNIAMTTQESKNITIAYNILTGASGYIMADWDKCDGLKIVNNVILGDEGECAVTIGKTTKGVVFKNNICNGQAVARGKEVADVSNNIYTVLASGQTKGKLEAGSVLEGDLSKIFVDAGKRDYHLKAGSVGIDAGVDVGMDRDLAGAKVPQGKGVDIGVFESKP